MHTYPYILDSESGHSDSCSQLHTSQHGLKAEETGSIVLVVKGKAPFFKAFIGSPRLQAWGEDCHLQTHGGPMV